LIANGYFRNTPFATSSRRRSQLYKTHIVSSFSLNELPTSTQSQFPINLVYSYRCAMKYTTFVAAIVVGLTAQVQTAPVPEPRAASYDVGEKRSVRPINYIPITGTPEGIDKRDGPLPPGETKIIASDEKRSAIDSRYLVPDPGEHDKRSVTVPGNPVPVPENSGAVDTKRSAMPAVPPPLAPSIPKGRKRDIPPPPLEPKEKRSAMPGNPPRPLPENNGEGDTKRSAMPALPPPVGVVDGPGPDKRSAMPALPPPGVLNGPGDKRSAMPAPPPGGLETVGHKRDALAGSPPAGLDAKEGKRSAPGRTTGSVFGTGR
jgi:hypothetical protein